MDGREFAVIAELPRRPRPDTLSPGLVPTNRQDEMTDVDDEDSDVLYDLACECEALFDVRLAELRNQQSPLTELLAEHQQRFTIWAAHLGVFARKSQSLDKRLENYPDIVDLAARLLDILRRSLAQLSKHTEPKAEGLSQSLPNDYQRSRDTALAALEATLPRLNRLGVTIRQASSEKMVLKAQKFATSLDLKSFSDISQSVVHALYPNIHRSLREYLAKSMTNRFATMLYLAHRGGKLRSRRRLRSPGLMPTIGEGEELTLRPLPPDPDVQAEPGRANQAEAAQPVAPSTASQSDLSTINSRQLRQAMRRTNYLEAPTERRKGTSSIQVRQGNYPPPPFQKDKNIAHCEWCEAQKRFIFISPRPTKICLTPGGSMPSPARAKSNDRERGMSVFCVVSPSRRSRRVRGRGCQSAKKKQLHQESDKRPKAAPGMRDPKPPTEVEDSSDDSDDSDGSLDMENMLGSDDAEMMARHIAGHLQVLMLLTVRLASLQNEKDDDDGQDANSDSVDLGDTSEGTMTADPKKTSDRGAPEDIEMPDVDEIPEEVVIPSGHSSIPDADVDFADIGVRRQHDDLPAEKDGFLQQLIKSGACQAHLDGDSEEGDLGRRGEVESLVHSSPPPEIECPENNNPFDGPNADVQIDNFIRADELDMFQLRTSVLDPGSAVAHFFQTRDPSCERARPLINVVSPTPIPTPTMSPSPEKMKAEQVSTAAAAGDAPSKDEKEQPADVKVAEGRNRGVGEVQD
ncbi:hypothetical protein MAPG_01097 [Magnaporthiopsis poae ATCC 64411]|uniref:Uncharacterized protein n=1 Tax=Magnaporthiopsis poae (strain ATCC 64411 / 73-15) TaxID=644358 RepID=A0A0C4DMT5_MAGP6|nr:hypothetical protein MAPG_01097 [Magnaporthiopsis poae ATCC 64411]